MLRDVPSWILYMGAWELAGTIAYTLSFALAETMLVFLPFLALGLLVPEKWSDRFAAVSGILLVLATGMAIVLHILVLLRRPWGVLLAGFALLLAGGAILGLRYPQIGKVTNAVGSRLTLLTSIYLGFDLIGLAIVISRNL